MMDFLLNSQMWQVQRYCLHWAFAPRSTYILAIWSQFPMTWYLSILEVALYIVLTMSVASKKYIDIFFIKVSYIIHNYIIHNWNEKTHVIYWYDIMLSQQHSIYHLSHIPAIKIIYSQNCMLTMSIWYVQGWLAIPII